MSRGKRRVTKRVKGGPAKATATTAGSVSTPAQPTQQPRCSNAESADRTTTVYRWILEGVPSFEIVQKCADAWGIGERQAREYIAKATDLLREESAKRAETSLEDHITLRWHLYRRACEVGDTKTAAMIAKDIARLQALYATDRSLLARAGLDSALKDKLDSADSQAADILRQVYDPTGGER